MLQSALYLLKETCAARFEARLIEIIDEQTHRNWCINPLTISHICCLEASVENEVERRHRLSSLHVWVLTEQIRALLPRHTSKLVAVGKPAENEEEHLSGLGLGQARTGAEAKREHVLLALELPILVEKSL